MNTPKDKTIKYMAAHVAEVRQVAEADGGDGDTFDIVISTDREDYMGDIVEQNWMLERYNKNPVVLWQHDYYRGIPIGRSLGLTSEEKDGQNLTVSKFKFRPAANEFDPVLPIRAAWDDGSLRAASVGFMALQIQYRYSEENPDEIIGLRYTLNELLEFSLVSIPANMDALRRSVQRQLYNAQAHDIDPVQLYDQQVYQSWALEYDRDRQRGSHGPTYPIRQTASPRQAAAAAPAASDDNQLPAQAVDALSKALADLNRTFRGGS